MIYVNGRFLLQNQTGVNRFAYELCRAWAVQGIPFVLCCPPGQIKDCYDTSGFHIEVSGWGKSHVWEQLSLPLWFCRKKGKKILVCFTGLSPVLTRRKVMTIHDLAFMANPKWYTRSYVFLYKLLTPLCAATARRILTVSQFSKGEIVRRLSVDGSRISVIPNAVSAAFSANVPVDAALEAQLKTERYVLAVSSIDPRKNFAKLLQAFRYVDDLSLKLYIVGGQDSIYATTIAELSEGAPAGRIKWLGRISDQALKSYYAHAQSFIYPSLYEGFGIPPLEAMACGAPVIVSAIPPLQEVCQDAALYVNPNDERDIADKINRILQDDNLRNALIAKGRVRSAAFSWQKSAGRLAEELRDYVQVP